MRKYSLTTFIGQGFIGVFRNGIMSTASILVLMSTLIVMGSFAALIININSNLDSIDDFNEIVCYIKLDVDQARVTQIGEEIKKLKNISSIRFISKDQALKDERARYGDEYSHLFDDYGEGANPLPDSFRLEYKNMKDVDILVYQLSQISGIDKVKNRLDISKNIAKLKRVISLTSMWLMVMLFTVSTFVIANTIKLAFYAREKEISIMRYIGATKFYITMPFIFEGLIIGLVAGLVACFAQWYIYTYLSAEIIKDYSIVSVLPYSSLSFYFNLAFLGAGILVGVIGSSLSIRRYMKV
jgi:Cell division protein